jgi:FMN-dependent NADH-azoreductase
MLLTGGVMSRILAEVPEEEHKYLKTCCAYIGITMKDFIRDAIIEKVDFEEDKLWLAQPETQDLLQKCSSGEMQFVAFDEYLKQENVVNV